MSTLTKSTAKTNYIVLMPPGDVLKEKIFEMGINTQKYSIDEGLGAVRRQVVKMGSHFDRRGNPHGCPMFECRATARVRPYNVRFSVGRNDVRDVRYCCYLRYVANLSTDWDSVLRSKNHETLIVHVLERKKATPFKPD